jgi:hypothetical protein
MAYLIFNSEDKFVRIAKDNSEKNLIINTHTTFKSVEISESDFLKLKYTSRGIDAASTSTNWFFSKSTDSSGTTFYTGTDFANKENNSFFDENGKLQPYNPSNPKHIIEFALNKKEFERYLNNEKDHLATILKDIGKDHPYFNKLNDFYSILKDFDTSSVSYPFQLTFLEYLDNQSLLSISPLQYPL